MTTGGAIPTSSNGGGGANLQYISRTKGLLKASLGTRRPWREMFDYHYISIPRPLNEAVGQIKTNVGYFWMNYVIVVLLILFLSLLWHPISLIVFVIMMAMWSFLYFLRDEPLVVFDGLIDDRVVAIVLAVVTIVLLLLTHATLNVVVSLAVGIVMVLIHAAFRKTDDLYLDMEEAAAGLSANAAGPSSSSS